MFISNIILIKYDVAVSKGMVKQSKKGAPLTLTHVALTLCECNDEE